MPFPNDIGKNSVHLMRFESWEFDEGVILYEQHGRRFFIDYPDSLGDAEWEDFRALAARNQEFYDYVTRQMIGCCLQIVSSVVDA